jgi:hypothetical protein
MSNSIKLASGFEIPVNTTTVLVAAVVLVTLSSQLFGLVKSAVQKGEAPACYGRSAAPAQIQPLPTDAAKQAEGYNLAAERRAVVLAQQPCPTPACTGNDQRTYSTAASDYLNTRMLAMMKMQNRYGDAGLEVARKVYGTFTDKNIMQGIIDRANAGIYAPKAPALKEAVQILTDPQRGARYLEPCQPNRQPS